MTNRDRLVIGVQSYGIAAIGESPRCHHSDYAGTMLCAIHLAMTVPLDGFCSRNFKDTVISIWKMAKGEIPTPNQEESGNNGFPDDES